MDSPQRPQRAKGNFLIKKHENRSNLIKKYTSFCPLYSTKPGPLNRSYRTYKSTILSSVQYKSRQNRGFDPPEGRIHGFDHFCTGQRIKSGRNHEIWSNSGNSPGGPPGKRKNAKKDTGKLDRFYVFFQKYPPSRGGYPRFS